jgi:transposase
MSKGTQLKHTEKSTILLLRNKGHSISEIAQIINRSRCVVINFLKNPEKYGTSTYGNYWHFKEKFKIF